GRDGTNADPLGGLAAGLEGHHAVDEGEQRMVAADAHVHARMHLRSALADDDVAGDHGLAAVLLHTEVFRVGVATVTGATTTFFVCHGALTFLSVGRNFFLAGRLLDLDFHLLEGGRAVAGLLHDDFFGHGGRAVAGDLAHDHFREVLTVSLRLAVALAALLLENADLVAAIVLEYFQFDDGAFDLGQADLDVCAVGEQQDVGHGKHLADGRAEPGELDAFTGRDLVLESAGNNHRIHGNTLVEKQGRKLINRSREFKGKAPAGFQNLP